MGKVIVKNIRRMGWTARIGLIAMFTMILTVLLYQGWRQSQDAHAAVAVQTQWAILGTGTTSTFPAMTLAKGIGSNRLLVVKVVGEYDSSKSTFQPTVTYGGQILTRINSTNNSSRQKVWIGYLKEADITSATGTPPAFTVNWGNWGDEEHGESAPSRGCGLSAAFYSNVDQGIPTTGSRAVSSDSGRTTPSSGTINVTNGGWAIYGLYVNQATATTTVPAGYTQHFDTANGTRNEDSVGSKEITVSGTENPRPAWDSYQRYAFVAAALNPATTTLGNGLSGTTGNLAPGAADQKLDGFSFVTSSAGTTDTNTELTVTTTNQAAIASMQIWNEAGTTQYFTTVDNPGSDTWIFGGGTPIPVTSTSANYRILATYKTRAGGAPVGNTVTTARVSAFTSDNLAAGTDTADTTLTLINSHAASTWGTDTAANAQITLNWTYGTAGQSVVVIRYTGNSDTTRPTDGTTYGVGNSFGTGGTVRYVGNATTLTDSVGIVNGTTYYYKIFEYDTYKNYYNATDVWTAALTPISPDAVPPGVDAGFAATTPNNTLAVPITSFGATDNIGGSGVSGYLITTTSAQPSAGEAGWTESAPTTFTVAGEGTHTLYPWAKDAGNIVSPLYGSPVTVVVDTTPPAVSGFTVNTPSSSLSIPIASLTGTDSGSGVAGYMITTSSAAPGAGAAGWTGTAPGTFSVAGDGTYTLYPWIKDAAENISAVSVSPRTVFVDTTPPTGLAATSPADESTDQQFNVALQSTTAMDSGIGGVTYWFQISDGDTYSLNSGWMAGTSFAPTGLTLGTTYIWSVKARDALGNETPLSVPRTFNTAATCVRNDPTLTLLTPTGGTASTITADGGTSVYNLKVINNDFGGCGSTQFNLSLSDIDFGDIFDPPALGVSSVTLAPGTQTATTVTVKATPAHVSGAGRTRAVSAADGVHLSMSTGEVQTTLNVVECTAKLPLLIVGPDSGYLNRGGSLKYTVTVKNTDSGTGCSAVAYNLSIPSENNATDFNTSLFSAPTLVLNAGQLGSTTLTVSAKAGAVKNAVNLTTVALAATGHTAPAIITVTSTVNNPMLHNSDNTSSTKWSANGGWGIPGARYGEFDCTTCHSPGGAATSNIKRIRESVSAPDTSIAQLPGFGQTIAYRRSVGSSAAQPVPGWDSGATPRASSTKVCEVCHTYDATGTNGVKAHPNATAAALGNHFGTDGKDCINCHKHQKGFSPAGLTCTGCHGTLTDTITPANRYVIAPPINASGVAGTLTGIGQVSNDPKVGAHQTHLQTLNGFSNYSTVDFRCEGCHGTLPTNFGHINGNSTPVFQGLAVRGGMSPAFNGTNLTCSNTYCHNPAGSGILLVANAGSKVFPSWTSASYVSSGTKSVANCSVCHKVPGVVGFQPSGTHAGMITDNTQDCAVCHGHNGDAAGALGRRHMDGIKFGAGNCDSCHGYDVGTWAAKQERSGVPEGKGAHEKHIAYLKARYGVTLTPMTDSFGTGTPWTAVCGVCHNGAPHNMSETIPGTGRSISIISARQFGTIAPIYNGIVGQSSLVTPKTCSNVDCHYKQTPVWSSY